MRQLRNRVLINSPFQLRFSFYVCSWLIALSFTYPLILSSLVDSFLRYLALDPAGPTLTYLENLRTEMLWLLVFMQCVFISLTFIISIYMSHRIAGPLYRLRKIFQETTAGNWDLKAAFRKKDYFQELPSEYNAMMESIRMRMIKKTKEVEAAIPRIEAALAKTSPEVRKELEIALQALRQVQKN